MNDELQSKALRIIDGRPVYRVIALPSRDLTRELIGAFAKSSLAVD